jgi:hypothetical protein
LDKGITFITPKVLTPISPNGVLPSATFKLVSYCFQSKLLLLMTKSFHDVSFVNDYGQSVHGVTMVLFLTALSVYGHCSFRSTCSIHGCTRENFVAQEVGWNWSHPETSAWVSVRLPLIPWNLRKKCAIDLCCVYICVPCCWSLVKVL